MITFKLIAMSLIGLSFWALLMYLFSRIMGRVFYDFTVKEELTILCVIVLSGILGDVITALIDHILELRNYVTQV